MNVRKHITIFDLPYPPDKMAEGLAVSEAVALGKCNQCIAIAQCKTDESFVFPASAWCMQRKSEILAYRNRRADDGKAD